MLEEIKCEKFKQKSISFKQGLNVVLGTNNGSNSIGKSTLLMIIDFVFGGDDYIYRCKEVRDAIGDHTIYFKFKFNNKSYYFSRSTKEHEKVYICDENYNPEAKYSLDDYMDQIAKFYGITPFDLTLRSAVATFSRIYHRETLNEEKPLNAAFREKTQDAIFRLLKLYNRYNSIVELNKKCIEMKEQLDTLKKAADYKYVAKINKEGYNKNTQSLLNLQNQLNDLEKENELGISNKNKIKSQRHNELLNQIQSLENARNSLQSEKNKLSIETKKTSANFEKLIKELSKFFDVKIENLTQIESFHIQLSSVLGKEFTYAKEKLDNSINYLSTEITKLEDEYKKLQQIDNVSKAILSEHLRLNKEIDKLTKENEFYKLKEKLNNDQEEAQKNLINSTENILNNLQIEINNSLSSLVEENFPKPHNPPRITLKSLDRYYYTTPNDGGTGTQQKGLILFDLVTLNNTFLPILIHDSILLKNIEDKSLGAIINEYCKTNKQIFIAYDRADTYTDEIRDTLVANSVIKLGDNGNQLFGFSFTEFEEQKKKELYNENKTSLNE